MNKPDWPKLAEGISEVAEILVDTQIAAAIGKGQLISSSAEEKSAKYACYELRIGSKIQHLVTDGIVGGEADLYREKSIAEDGVFSVMPGQTFKIYAMEDLYMPADMFAITIPVGNLYKLGLNPETSFADPGFAGSFFVTVCNYSPRLVKLKVGEPLARVFFFHLAVRPDRVHDGKPRDLPPSVERVRRPSNEDLVTKGEAAVLKEVLAEVDPPHYEHVFVTERIVSLHRKQSDARLRTMDQQYAAVTFVSLLSLLIILLVAAFYFGEMLKTFWPDLFSSIVLKSFTALVTWSVFTLVVSPIRRAFLGALRIALSKE